MPPAFAEENLHILWRLIRKRTSYTDPLLFICLKQIAAEKEKESVSQARTSSLSMPAQNTNVSVPLRSTLFVYVLGQNEIQVEMIST